MMVVYEYSYSYVVLFYLSCHRADNHYAMDTSNGPTADDKDSSDYILDYVNSVAGIYVYCEDSTPHYITDPTGWGIQLDVTFTTAMAEKTCDSRRRLQGPPPPPGDDDHFGPPPDDMGPGGDDNVRTCPCSSMTYCYASTGLSN